MKKLFTLAVATLLFTGASYACGDKNKKCSDKEKKECATAKDGKKDCCKKKDKAAKKSEKEKPTASPETTTKS